jgi:tetratricopeptide (TPR) repeat protein
MFRAGLPRLAASLALIAGFASGSSAAHAQADQAVAPGVAAPEAERSRASALFEEARRLYEAGDFTAAAESFERAYAAAPHHAAAWNAARAWHKAGELPRAATLYQRYLREAPWDAPDRDAAGRSLTELRALLGRVEVQPPGVKGVTVDGREPEYDEVWVVPGSHVVESVSGIVHRREGHGRHSRLPGPARVIKVDVAAGWSVSVAIVPETAAAEPATPPPSPPDDATRARGATASDDGGWPAWAILPFAGATALAAGGLVASGIDTENLHEEFEASGETSGYALDNGRFAMHRTNVLVAVTAGLGAVTLGVALFAIDWNGDGGGGRVVGVATPRGFETRGTF